MLKCLLALSLFGSITGLTTPSAARGAARLADSEKQLPIYQACTQLAQATAEEYARQEDRERIRCLSSDRISASNYQTLIHKFSQDCTRAIVKKLGPRFDQDGDHDVHLTQSELSTMFDKHYRAVYDQHCASSSVGEATVTPPGR